MGTRVITGKKAKQDIKLLDYIKKEFVLNDRTGQITAHRVSAHLIVSIHYGGSAFTVTFSHLIFFLKHGRWPQEGMQLDHVDDNPFNNAPSNLKEVTQAENQAKKRGRSTRGYGKTKYGHGISVSWSKSKNLYRAQMSLNVEHKLRTEHGIKQIFIAYGATLEEIDMKVKEYIDKSILNPPDLDDFIE